MNKNELERRLGVAETDLPFTNSDIPTDNDAHYELKSSAIERLIRQYVLTPAEKMIDLKIFLNEIHDKTTNVMKQQLRNGPVKTSLSVQIELVKDDGNRLKHTNPHPFFTGNTEAVLSTEQVGDFLSNSYSNIERRLETYVQKGSGWRVHRILSARLDFAKYAPLKGSSYIDLPSELKNKKAIIILKNTDDKCLMWSLLSALYPVDKDAQRVSKYVEHQSTLSFKDIHFPTPLTQIRKVEKLNDLAINVFGYENFVYPLYLSENYSIKPINLILINGKNEKDEDTSHYCWIKDFNKLCYNQTNHKRQKHFCMRCVTNHASEETLAKHMEYCKGVNAKATRTVFPAVKGDGSPPIIQFKNYKHLLKCPYVIYADTESIIRPILTCAEERNTVKDNVHQGCSFAYNVVRSDGTLMMKRLYRGEDAMEHFFKSLEQDLADIRDDLKNIRKINMTDEDTRNYKHADTCWICNGSFKLYVKGDKSGLWKVRDHDHITGEFRGAAHSTCNQKLSIKPFIQPIPVFFHNLKGYDAHLLMSALGNTTEKVIEYTNAKGEEKEFRDGKISCIAQNMEKLISFSYGQFRFVDSFAFLSTSLNQLVKNTPKENLHITKMMEHFELLCRKGVYPYEYMNDFNKFEETRLPTKDLFYSKLTDETISDEEYAHAQNVWSEFTCETLGDYHDLYLQTDVNLLSDVFENFRQTAMGTYGLDPANYYTLPGYAWDVLLKDTKIELQLLTDPDTYLFIEKGLRGGISMVSQRLGEANNPYMKDYEKSKPTSYLQYLDANNLYGWAMCQYLPTSGFKWSEKNIDDVLKTGEDSEHGYILEVDLEYPEDLQDLHNDYPLAPESLVVANELFSSYQKDLINKLGSTGGNVSKLVPNLMDKEKYILHYRNLQLYVSLGMKIKQVHKVLEFNQSAWMEPYIMKNTELRKDAKNDFEKDFYKLMNNAVFGKTMENVRNRVDIKLMRTADEKRIKTYIAKPTYVRSAIFNEDLIGIENHKTEVKLNKPIYVGMSILDLSKHLMYDFYYNQLKKQYGDRVRLLYTDTDSVIIHVRTDDLYEDMKKNMDLYDTSNFPEDHPSYCTTNKKVVGKFKDELGGKIMTEFVGLRPKMYSYHGEESGKRAKGVKKSVLKKTITHDDYRACLCEQKIFQRNMTGLRSYDHQIYGETVRKVALSPLDTKRYILQDGKTTLAFGHRDIPETS